MLKSQIQVGKFYVAKVNDKLTTVRVDAIGSGFDSTTYYEVTNLSTGRKTTFRSAQKFRKEVVAPSPFASSATESASIDNANDFDGIVNRLSPKAREEVEEQLKTINQESKMPQVEYCTGEEPDCCEGDMGSAEEGICAACGKPINPAEKVSPTPSGLAAKLAARSSVAAPHLIVEARAGTGKTTTLIEGLKKVKGIPSKLIPSPQQKAVWEQMELSREAKSICFVAFNKSIATELQQRVPTGCDAMTMHSMGFKAVMKTFGRCEPTSYRVQDIISDILELDIREIRRNKPALLAATEQLVSLVKMNLTETDPETLAQIAEYYEIEMNGSRAEAFDLVPKVIEACKNVKGKIDFNDMIWLPVILDLPVFKYDLLLVDEAQDLNRCQQALAKKAGKRLILCGDPKQAIYGFAGADCQSMSRMEDELKATPAGCVHLPLTVTRRCGKAIVKEANKYVPDFEAFETNSDGLISSAKYEGEPDNRRQSGNSSYLGLVQDGDMVLCRVNAPLVSQCFRFLKAGRKATIQGRDIGTGLITTIKKCKAENVVDLTSKLSDWLAREQHKENSKRNPNEAKLIALQDRYDCLCCFCDGAETVEQVIEKIENIFTDDKGAKGIRLSSVHKAKGLEAHRVFILIPKGAAMPHPMAKTAWAKEQEYNLLYVAITRAINELVWVS